MSEIDLCLSEIALCLSEIALPIKDMLQNDEVFILVPYFQECLPGVIVNCEFIFVEHYGTFVILIVVGLNLAEWAEPLIFGLIIFNQVTYHYQYCEITNVQLSRAF
jgi:hypothetical protein